LWPHESIAWRLFDRSAEGDQGSRVDAGSGIFCEAGKHRQRGAVRNGIHDTSNAPPQPRSGEELAKAMIAGAELKKKLAPSWKTTKGVYNS